MRKETTIQERNSPKVGSLKGLLTIDKLPSQLRKKKKKVGNDNGDNFVAIAEIKRITGIV